MSVDAHAHVWDPARASYPWLGPHLGPLDRAFGAADLAGHLDDERTAGVVLVQASDDVRDTDVMAAVAAREPRVLGLVVGVPLDRPDEVAAQLARARTLAAHAHTRVVGVRTLQHDRSDPDWIRRPAADAGLGVLATLGLPYDYVTADPAALAHLPAIGARHPGLRLVVDHLGKPPLGDAAGLERWRTLLVAAARVPLVVAKLSGLYAASDATLHATLHATVHATSAPGASYVDDVRRVVDVALDVLGPDRLMVGSDWPMSLLAGGPSAVRHALDGAVDDALRGDPAALAAVRGGTARAVYGLDGPSSSGCAST